MTTDPRPEKEKRSMPQPPWLENLEKYIASLMPVSPNIISGIKLLVIFPMLVLALKQVGALPGHPYIVLILFLFFGILDYLDSTIARQRGLETAFGRFLDRVTDFPVLLTVSIFCIEILPVQLLILKLMLDLVIIVLYVQGQESTENRLQNAVNYTTLLALLAASQGWSPQFFTPESVIYLLWVNIVFSGVVVLYNLNILQKRFIADALSGGNLLCGIFSMIMASKGRVDISLLFLMLGAAFDGFDGAAARRYGGTRWGVYSDDIADGVNYAVAPGVALYFALPSPDGYAVGIFYSLFTVSRLVFFTLNKAYSDPNYFCGVPSTVGAIVALCSLILFKEHPVLIGLMVGVACIQMVSFDTHYRHLGRALASNRRVIYGMPVMIILLIAGNFLLSKNVPVTVILGASLVYGFLPTVTHFVRLIENKG
jgi:CDP-diacylglycerol--serine O-phosphatidyltransferase